MNFFDSRNAEIHHDKEQFLRQLRAQNLKMDYVDFAEKVGRVDNITVSLEKCSCLDFNKRHKPCKHMYRLAMDLKIFAIENSPITLIKRDIFEDNGNEIVEKVFSVEYGVFYVQFTKDRFGVSAHCSCPAGKYKTLCRHVIQCITEDEEIAEIMREEGLLQMYEEYIEKEKLAEELKRESTKLKKRFARLLLE